MMNLIVAMAHVFMITGNATTGLIAQMALMKLIVLLHLVLRLHVALG
jgi:hypothetical protein